jgi:hypothetical protein
MTAISMGAYSSYSDVGEIRDAVSSAIVTPAAFFFLKG